jgi:hypothetical protein
VVLRLVDCSLLTPPRAGADGQSRYGMLETLRAYGAGLLAEAGEQDQAAAAPAGYALQVAEEAAAGLQSSDGELAAAHWLDAEDATMRQGLAWAVAHDPAAALQLAAALNGGGSCRAGWPGSIRYYARPLAAPRWAVTGGPPRGSGSAGPRCSRPIQLERSVISPRSATPSRTGRRPRR